MRKLLLALVVVIGATLTGLLLASLLLKQECPDCSGTARHLRENPSQCLEGPAVLDCPRCGDIGRVSLFQGRFGPAPDPLIAALMAHSNRSPWPVEDLLEERLKASPLRRASGRDWSGSLGLFGRSRFLREDGQSFVVLLRASKEAPHGGDNSMRITLFDRRGTPLDIVNLAAVEGASYPAAKFVIPVVDGGPCVQVSLLNWKNRPCKAVEIDHAGKLWKKALEEPGEKLEQVEWAIHLRNGKLRVADARGKTIAE